MEALRFWLIRSLNATLAKLMERSSLYFLRLKFSRDARASGLTTKLATVYE